VIDDRGGLVARAARFLRPTLRLVDRGEPAEQAPQQTARALLARTGDAAFVGGARRREVRAPAGAIRFVLDLFPSTDT